MFGGLVLGVFFGWMLACLLVCWVFFLFQHRCSAASCFANVSVVVGKVPKHWPVQTHFLRLLGP